MKNPKQTIGTVFSQTIFSVITRLLLGVWLFFTDPVSVTFRYLLVIIFCIPLLRYVLHKATGTTMENALSGSFPKGNVARVILCGAMFIVYIFAMPYIFSVYTSSFPAFLLALVLPVVVAFLLISEIIKGGNTINNEQSLMLTMAFYILPFLAGINFAFDFSRPEVKQYYVTGREEYTASGTSAPDEGPSTFYYLYLLPMDSVKGPLHWIEVSDSQNKNILMFNGSGAATINCIRYIVVNTERRLNSVRSVTPGVPNSVAASYHWQVFRTNDKVVRTGIKYGLYQRYVPGDYLYIDEYRGLLGFPWRNYR
ncbi:hypothetical protein [Chitinophaga sp. RAB17]|uniref:hypothetical protein n=1 Tax=Chitinophaga sp. RAB17 TaxID=3233049 RepID=UPI003F8F9642